MSLVAAYASDASDADDDDASVLRIGKSEEVACVDDKQELNDLGPSSDAYPNTDAQYPSSDAYPNTDAQYPSSDAYPNTDAQYPNSDVYPNTDAQYPSSDAYPNTDAQFPSSDAYPNTDAQYPSSDAYPNADAQYPSSDAYPDTDAQYPSSEPASSIHVYPNTDDQCMRNGSWREYRDYKSGCTYFHNDATGVSSWDEPTEGYEPLAVKPVAPPGWIVTLSEESGQYYFYDPDSGQSTWEQPSETISTAPSKTSAAENDDLPPEVAARLRALKGEVHATQPTKAWNNLRGAERHEPKRRRVNPNIDLMDVSAPNYSDQFTVDPPVSRYRGERRNASTRSKQTAVEAAAVQAASALKAVTSTRDHTVPSAATDLFRHFGGTRPHTSSSNKKLSDSERRAGWDEFEARLARA